MEKRAVVRYSGNHEKHPIDDRIIQCVNQLVNNLTAEINITAQIVFDDDKNRYAITFAWEGKVFVSAIYNPEETDDDQKFQIVPSGQTMCFMWFAEVFFYLKLAAMIKDEEKRIEIISRKAHEKLLYNRKEIFRIRPEVFHKYDTSLVYIGRVNGIHLPVPPEI
ncbi:MAG: hypothetical protein HYY55_02415 [Candidatus Niyogibacteria bacterium]|nr:MAG: hypothetical protein HYY55_02415 [Candidatus Niyogibacteria bacterium]